MSTSVRGGGGRPEAEGFSVAVVAIVVLLGFRALKLAGRYSKCGYNLATAGSTDEIRIEITYQTFFPFFFC